MSNLPSGFVAATLWRLIPPLSTGGATWTVSRAIGDGISADPVRAEIGTITGYAVQTMPKVGGVVVASPASTSDWQLITRPGSALVQGDELVSVADPTLRFQVQAQPDQLLGGAFVSAAIEALP